MPSLLQSRRGRLVAAADADPARRSWAGAQIPAARLYPHWEHVLDDPDVDALIVALPTALHAEVACRAFAAGKHVFLEKPIGLSVDEGRRVVTAWRAAGTVGAIGYNFRRSPIVESAQRTLATGALGSLVGIQGSFQVATDRILGWRTERALGGGALLDLLSHHVDLVLALTHRSVVRVHAEVRTLRTPDDTVAVQMVDAEGMVAQLQGSYAAGAHVNRLDLVGTRGTLRVDLLDARPRAMARAPGRGARLIRAGAALADLHPARLLRAPGFEPSFSATLEAFLHAVRGGAPFHPDPDDGLRTQRVLEAAQESASRGGAPVTVVDES